MTGSEDFPRGPGSDSRFSAARVREANTRRRFRFGAVVFALVIAAVGAYLVLRPAIGKSADWAVRIDGETVLTLGDLATVVAFEAEARGTSELFDLTTVPFEVLHDAVETELVGRIAFNLGVTVLEEQIDTELAGLFLPDAALPLDEQDRRIFEEIYRSFLNRSGVSAKFYEDLVLAQLLRSEVKQILGMSQFADERLHMEISWIVLDPEHPDPFGVAEAVRFGADFSKAAQALSVDAVFAVDTGLPGYVGWVPRGAFPELDDELFGPQAFAPGTIIGPVFTLDAVIIIEVIDGPTSRLVAPGPLQGRIQQVALDAKIAEERMKVSVEFNLDSANYDWVVSEVLDSQPRSPR